jgi:MoxR-like ATPase
MRASDPHLPTATPSTKKLLRYGGGVRGGQSMILAAKVRALMEGRGHVSFADLKRVALPALRHRIIPNFEAEAEGMSTDAILQKILGEVPEMPASVQRLDA